MARIGRCTIVLLVSLLFVGCRTPARPYAHDPLVRKGVAVRGDPTRSDSRQLTPPTFPVPPRPPESLEPLELPPAMKLPEISPPE